MLGNFRKKPHQHLRPRQRGPGFFLFLGRNLSENAGKISRRQGAVEVAHKRGERKLQAINKASTKNRCTLFGAGAC